MGGLREWIEPFTLLQGHLPTLHCSWHVFWILSLLELFGDDHFGGKYKVWGLFWGHLETQGKRENGFRKEPRGNAPSNHSFQINKPLVLVNMGVTLVLDSDHFWREHPHMNQQSNGTFNVDLGST